MNHIANYLKKLTIENFQSHIKTTIEPAPPGQLTVITGPSDSGKTAILRALRWLLVNEPDGDSFIRVGATFARVTMEHGGTAGSGDGTVNGDGAVIRHRTTGGTNRYIVNGEKLEGFGRGNVPLEVSQITGVRPVKIGDLEFNLNIAEQLDGPFLGSSISGGARAKVLGKLAGTEEIDYAGKALGTDLHRRNQDEKRLKSEVAGLGEEIKEYDWLLGAKRKIEALERLAGKIKAAQERRGRLFLFKEQVVQFDVKIAGCHAVLYCWRNLEQAEQLAINIAENQRSEEVLAKLVNNYLAYKKNVWACEKTIKQYVGLLEAERKLQIIQAAILKTGQLRKLKTIYLAGQELIRKNQDILARTKGAERAGKLATSIQEKITRQDLLERLARSYGKAGMLVSQEQIKIESLQQVFETEKLLQAANETTNRRNILMALRTKHANLDSLAQKSRGQAVVWENRVAELEGAYHDLLEDVGICPLCGQEIKSKVKEAV